ncbi:hypothetical protein, partial [Neisseria meningitidis]|uniref:hypothetical protein n=1 Tax=Neisseria meningitidis TaxID=487 RepID=UPI001C8F21CF
VSRFPLLREWRFGSYLKFKKKKRKPDGLDSRLRGNDGFRLFFDFLFFAGMTVWVLSLWSCDAGNAV